MTEYCDSIGAACNSKLDIDSRIAEREGFDCHRFRQPTVTSTDSDSNLYLGCVQAVSSLRVCCLWRPLTTSVDHNFHIN
jgi:hypothetical protein